jgi:hypothetical protein
VHVVVRQTVSAPHRVHLNAPAGCGIEGDGLAEQMRARLEPGTPVVAEGLYLQPMDAGGMDLVLRNRWSADARDRHHRAGETGRMSNDPIIIALTGRAGVGKDTAANDWSTSTGSWRHRSPRRCGPCWTRCCQTQA